MYKHLYFRVYIAYWDKIGETTLENRIKIYEKQKTKTSCNLISGRSKKSMIKTCFS